MPRYNCRIEGSLIVDADDEDSARIKAEMTRDSEWDWDSIEVDED